MQPVSYLESQLAQHLRPKAAAKYLGIGESTFFKYAKEDPTFPKGVKLSARCTLYFRGSLDAWVLSKSTAPVAA